MTTIPQAAIPDAALAAAAAWVSEATSCGLCTREDPCGICTATALVTLIAALPLLGEIDTEYGVTDDSGLVDVHSSLDRARRVAARRGSGSRVVSRTITTGPWTETPSE